MHLLFLFTHNVGTDIQGPFNKVYNALVKILKNNEAEDDQYLVSLYLDCLGEVCNLLLFIYFYIIFINCLIGHLLVHGRCRK